MTLFKALSLGAIVSMALSAPAMAQGYDVPDGWQDAAIDPNAEFHELPDQPAAAAVNMEQRLTLLLNHIGGASFAEIGPVWREGDRYLVRAVTPTEDVEYWVLDGTAGLIVRVE